MQTTTYGSRVRVKVLYKDVYGPYRRSVDSARSDLSKLIEKDRSPMEKKVWLQQLKCSIGVRLGGRDRIYCRGKDYGESSEGAAETMEIGLPDCGEHEEVSFNKMSLCTAVGVDREEEEVPYYGIPPCTAGKVDSEEEEVPGVGIPSCTDGKC